MTTVLGEIAWAGVAAGVDQPSEGVPPTLQSWPQSSTGVSWTRATATAALPKITAATGTSSKKPMAVRSNSRPLQSREAGRGVPGEVVVLELAHPGGSSCSTWRSRFQQVTVTVVQRRHGFSSYGVWVRPCTAAGRAGQPPAVSSTPRRPSRGGGCNGSTGRVEGGAAVREP